MKTYAISGLGADRRVFDPIKDRLNIEVIDWIKPIQDENIKSYAKRMAEFIDSTKPFYILGVSFGGLIAIEISKFLNPEKIILISSAQNHNELRWIYRLLGTLRIDKLIPEKLYKPPRFLILQLLGAKNKNLAKRILADMDIYFTKWAIGTLIRWKSDTKFDNLIKIQGDRDLLMPYYKAPNSIIINGGKHFMIADRSEEIAEIINNIL